MTTLHKTDRETTQERAEDFLSGIGRCYAEHVLEEYEKSEKDIAMTEVPEALRAKVMKSVRTAGEETTREEAARMQRQTLNILITE